MTDKTNIPATPSLMAFAKWIPIPTRKGPQQFGNCIAEQQEQIIHIFEQICGGVLSGSFESIKRLFWCEATTSWGKDQIVAVVVIWLLLFCKRKLTIRLYAVDKEQARLVKSSADDILRLCPELRKLIESQVDGLINAETGSICTVVSADSASAHGDRPDMTFISEASRLKNRDLYDAAFSNASKTGSPFVVMTNAGNIEHFTYQQRTEVIGSDRWAKLFLKERPPWRLAEDDRDSEIHITPLEYQQKFLGEWTAGGGCPLIDQADLSASVRLLSPARRRPAEATWSILGFDAGIHHDLTSAVVSSWSAAEQMYSVNEVRAWAPYVDETGKKRPVDLEIVQQEVLELMKLLEVDQVFADPTQAEQLLGNLEREGVPVFRVKFGGNAANRLCGFISNVFRQRQVCLYPDQQLIKELSKLRLQEESWGGAKVVSPRTNEGHCDRAQAFLYSVYGLFEFAESYQPPVDLPRMPQTLDMTGGTLIDEMCRAHGINF